jgi:hypothetical protein
MHFAHTIDHTAYFGTANWMIYWSFALWQLPRSLCPSSSPSKKKSKNPGPSVVVLHRRQAAQNSPQQASMLARF